MKSEQKTPLDSNREDNQTLNVSVIRTWTKAASLHADFDTENDRPKNRKLGSIRIQYQKIHRLTVVITAVIAGLIALLTFQGLRFAVGTDLVPKGSFIEDIAGTTDQQILQDEFSRLSGTRSRKAVAMMKDDVGEMIRVLNEKQSAVIACLKKHFMDTGSLNQRS